MKFTFKVLPNAEKNEWIGWFGDNVIKLRITNDKLQLREGLEEFLNVNLGIHKEDLKLISAKDNTLLTYELPDVAWELFLTAIEK